jgi:alkylated DNA repair dioxygenase AlkB
VEKGYPTDLLSATFAAPERRTREGQPPRENRSGRALTQLSLFEACDGVLVDDERGRITYTSDFVSARDARAWFDELRQVVPWSAERRVMYEREVDVPRLIARYRLEGDAAPLPESLRTAAARVKSALGVGFNGVGLNLYRTGHDSVAPHNDHLGELRVGDPIALLSLGATRRMTVRAKQPPRRVLHVELASGSLFVMSYATQVHYSHGIPKTDEPVGERISLAFRVRPVSPPAGSSRY